MKTHFGGQSSFREVKSFVFCHVSVINIKSNFLELNRSFKKNDLFATDLAFIRPTWILSEPAQSIIGDVGSWRRHLRLSFEGLGPTAHFRKLGMDPCGC